MKLFVGLAIGIALATTGLTSCGQEETVESKVITGCTDAMNQNEPIGPSGPDDALTDRYIESGEATLVEMSFEDLTATALQSGGVTEMWIVEGTATATWEKNISPSVYDDDGKPDPLPSVTERFSCDMGFRPTDSTVVAFEYTTFHPTSGGSQSTVLVPRNADGS